MEIKMIKGSPCLQERDLLAYMNMKSDKQAFKFMTEACMINPGPDKDGVKWFPLSSAIELMCALPKPDYKAVADMAMAVCNEVRPEKIALNKIAEIMRQLEAPEDPVSVPKKRAVKPFRSAEDILAGGGPFTQEEAGAILGVAPNTVANYRKKNPDKLSMIKTARGYVVYTLEDIEVLRQLIGAGKSPLKPGEAYQVELDLEPKPNPEDEGIYEEEVCEEPEPEKKEHAPLKEFVYDLGDPFEESRPRA